MVSPPGVAPSAEALEQLATAAPTITHKESYDPGPWLESYAVGVGSPLEFWFLRICEHNGIEVEKQVAIAVKGGAKPIRVADFMMKRARRAIFVDGAVFHHGERLRRDRSIRQRLKATGPPWEVITLTAWDTWSRSREPVQAARRPRYRRLVRIGASPARKVVVEGELSGYEVLEELGGGAMVEFLTAVTSQGIQP